MRAWEYLGRAVQLGSVIGVLASLTACTTVGERKFACPGRPPGVHCMTTSEVYEATQNSEVVTPTAPHALGDDPEKGERAKRARKEDGGSNQSRARAALRADAPPIATAELMPAIEKPVPIRTPAQVMRIWIAPWRDTHDVAHSGGYDFIEVTTRRWVFGEDTTDVEPVRVFSIQPLVGEESKESVGKDQPAPAARVGSSERAKTSTSTLPTRRLPNDSSVHTPPD